MARIFLVLALFATALMATNIGLGLASGDFAQAAHNRYQAARELDRLSKSLSATAAERDAARRELARQAESFRPFRQHLTIHIWTGIAATLIAMLVNAVSVTYFIGTNRWCREVAEVYQLPPELPRESTRLKRRTFPWSLASMLVLIGIVMLGAAADASTDPTAAPRWVVPHYLFAIAGTVFVGWSFFVQLGRIGANYEVIEQILVQTQSIRKQYAEQAVAEQPVAESAASPRNEDP